MRVLCIEDSICPDPSAILVKKGSEYNVTDIVPGLVREGTNNNTWYKLLETGECTHHSSIFHILPSEEEIAKERLSDEFNKKINISRN